MVVFVTLANQVLSAPITIDDWPCTANPIQLIRCGPTQDIACPLGGTGDAFYELNVVNGNYEPYPSASPVQFDSGGPSGIDSLNACGVNPIDGKAYCAMKTVGLGHYVIRLDSAGDFGYVAELPGTRGNAADFSDSGEYYYKATGIDGTLFLTISGLDTLQAFDDPTEAAILTSEKPYSWIGDSTESGEVLFSGVSDYVVISGAYNFGGTVVEREYGIGLSNDPVSSWNPAAPTDNRHTLVVFWISDQINKRYDFRQFAIIGSADSTDGYGAAWNYDGRVFFSNNGGGVFEVFLGTIDISTFEARIGEIGPSVVTSQNDGLNCRSAPLPFPVCSDVDFQGNPFDCAAIGLLYDSSLDTTICTSYNITGCTEASEESCCMFPPTIAPSNAPTALPTAVPTTASPSTSSPSTVAPTGSPIGAVFREVASTPSLRHGHSHTHGGKKHGKGMGNTRGAQGSNNGVERLPDGNSKGPSKTAGGGSTADTGMSMGSSDYTAARQQQSEGKQGKSGTNVGDATGGNDQAPDRAGSGTDSSQDRDTVVTVVDALSHHSKTYTGGHKGKSMGTSADGVADRTYTMGGSSGKSASSAALVGAAGSLGRNTSSALVGMGIVCTVCIALALIAHRRRQRHGYSAIAESLEDTDTNVSPYSANEVCTDPRTMLLNV